MAKAGDRYEVTTGNIWGYAHRGDLTGVTVSESAARACHALLAQGTALRDSAPLSPRNHDLAHHAGEGGPHEGSGR
jgi:hypothetical protein